jgi:uncharacterized Zn-binding protein involved in type VI secretion
LSKPVAKGGDTVVGVDTHIVMIPSPGGPVPTPMPMPFNGKLSGSLSTTVFIDGQGVAVVGSTADNSPAHIPTGGPFQKSPANKATVSQGSDTVFADDKKVARLGDTATCCNDPSDQDTGQIVAAGTVLAG